MALSDNLVAYWKLDEASGNASDSSGNGYTLTNNNTVAFASGKINNGANFGNANTNSYFSASSNLGLNTQQAGIISFSGWVKLGTAPTNGIADQIFFLGSNTQSQWGMFYYNNAGTMQIYARNYNTTSAGQNLIWNYTLTTGTWYHVALVKNGTTVTLYVNGASQGNNTITAADGADSAPSANFGLGYQTDNLANPWQGMLDECAFWNRALSANEVSALYNNGNGLAYPLQGLVFDSASNGTANSTTLTISHTVTGTNPILFVGVGDITGTGAWHITSVTYNGVAMTEITHAANAGGEVAGLFYLINPATGTHNIVITSSSTDFLKGVGVSYTGAKQTSQPDSSNSGIVDPGTSITESTTVVATNAWLMSFVANASALAMTASTGVNSVRTNTSDHAAYIGDSNGTVGTGSQSQTWTSSSQSMGMIIVSIAPYSTAVASSPMLMLMGVGS